MGVAYRPHGRPVLQRFLQLAQPTVHTYRNADQITPRIHTRPHRQQRWHRSPQLTRERVPLIGPGLRRHWQRTNVRHVRHEIHRSIDLIDRRQRREFRRRRPLPLPLPRRGRRRRLDVKQPSARAAQRAPPSAASPVAAGAAQARGSTDCSAEERGSLLASCPESSRSVREPRIGSARTVVGRTETGGRSDDLDQMGLASPGRRRCQRLSVTDRAASHRRFDLGNGHPLGLDHLVRIHLRAGSPRPDGR